MSDIYTLKNIPMSPENILQEADRLVSGDRQDSYKHPTHDYECTSVMWAAMIKKRYGVDVPLTPDFCTLMMAAMKISREVGKHKRDNLVDLAGYARCTEMILELQSQTPDTP